MMLRICFISESYQMLFSSVYTSPPYLEQMPPGHLEQMKEPLHCQRTLKVHLKRKKKTNNQEQQKVNLDSSVLTVVSDGKKSSKVPISLDIACSLPPSYMVYKQQEAYTEVFYNLNRIHHFHRS